MYILNNYAQIQIALILASVYAMFFVESEARTLILPSEELIWTSPEPRQRPLSVVTIEQEKEIGIAG